MLIPYRKDSFNPPIPFLTGDAATLHSIISEIDRVNSLDYDGVREHQNALLNPLINHFSKKDPKFKERLVTNSPTKEFTISDLALIKPEGKAYFQTLVSNKGYYSNKVPKHHLPAYWAETSGSTGVPLRIQNTAISRAIAMAYTPWNYVATGVDFAWKLASVKPTNKGVSHCESWEGATELLFKTGEMLSLSSSEDVLTQLDELENFSPDFLIVFPSVLNEYTQLWKNGVRNPIPLKIIRTMGETLREETRDLASQLTGATVLDTYSSSEVGRIATQVKSGEPYLLNNYSLIVEILRENGEPCENGEVGRVVITDLSNYATPIIRYDIGDYATPADAHCLTLESVQGRARNMVTLPNGEKIWPLVGYREFSKIIPIRQFHIQQVKPDSLVAKFHVDFLPSDDQREKICKIIRDNLGYNFRIDATYQLEPIKKGANQKLEDFVSLV